MNEQPFRPGSVAAAAILIGGGLIAAFPQHSMSIIRLVIVTIAAAAGLFALGVNAPATWWRSPFERGLPLKWKRSGAHELHWIRSEMAGWRQRIANGPPLPPEVVRRLQPLIAVEIERAGADPADEAIGEYTRQHLSPLTIAVFTADAGNSHHRFRFVPPNRGAVAAAVHAVLDDLERLARARSTPTSDTRGI